MSCSGEQIDETCERVPFPYLVHEQARTGTLRRAGWIAAAERDK